MHETLSIKLQFFYSNQKKKKYFIDCWFTIPLSHFFSRAAEDRARQLLHPAGLSVPVLNQARIRVVVFRDEKGVKQPIFDSQQISIDDGGEVGKTSRPEKGMGGELDYESDIIVSVTNELWRRGEGGTQFWGCKNSLCCGKGGYSRASPPPLVSNLTYQ